MAMLLLSGGGEGAAMERNGGMGRWWSCGTAVAERRYGDIGAAASMERWCAVVCGIPSD